MSDRRRIGRPPRRHWAAGHGHLDACMVLVSAGLSSDDADDVSSRPLHWALVGVEGNAFGVGARLDVARWLLDRGANPNAATSDGNACAHWAAWAGGADAIRLLVSYGADLGPANCRGCTVAHWAASGGDLETLDFLADLGVDFALPNLAGHTPLEHAVAHGRSKATDWFLDRGVVDRHAVEYALQLARLDPTDAHRRTIAADLAPFVVPGL